MPVIYDPATTLSNGSGGFTRTAFPGNTIPSIGSIRSRSALLQRYPLPTSPGTANNYRRTANEIDDQDQWDARIDQRFARTAIRCSAACRTSASSFTPVTPLPDGSGVTTGTLGPQDTVAWSFASNYQHTFSDQRC